MATPPQILSSRLGITPSATPPIGEPLSGSSNQEMRWYDRECIPIAQSVARWAHAQGWPGAEHKILEGLASAVETFSTRGANPLDAGHLNDMLEDGIVTNGVNYIQNLKAQVKTKCMLLQRIAAAVGYQPGPSDHFVTSRVMLRGALNSRIERIIKTTVLWPRTFNAIKDHVGNLQGPGQLAAPSAPPANLSSPQASHYHELKMLLGARNNLCRSSYFVAEANLQLVAFMLHWHSTRNTPFPRDSEVFFGQLADATQGMPFSPIVQQDLEKITISEREDLFLSLKTALDLAVHVSPLVLLAKLPGSNFHLARPVLIKWGQELGPKPEFILNAEHRMWNMIVGIAAGNEASSALQWLVHYCSHDMDILGANSDAISAFFANTAPSETISTPASTSPDDAGFGADLIGTGDDVDMETEPFEPPLTNGNSGAEPMEEIAPSRPPSPNIATHEDVSSPQDIPSPPMDPAEPDSAERPRSESPLTDLDTSEGNATEDESESEDPIAPAGQIVKSSGRVIKPPQIYTSGVTLTPAPAAKKRKLEIEAAALPGTPPLSVKRESLFWTSAFGYVSAAASEAQPNAAPTKQKKKKGSNQPTERSDKIVPIPIFDESHRSGFKVYNFQPDVKSAKFDIPLVEKVVRMVQSKAGGAGHPPHWQPAASQSALSSGCSSIFVVDCNTFKQMSPLQIQEVHRHRHILVTGVDSGRPIQFDEQGLEMLADVDAEVQIQHSDRKSKFKSQAMLEPGRLRDLIHNVKSDSATAMNVLDLPLGKTTVPIPPAYVDVATDAHSVNAVKRLVELKDMGNITSWGTAGTAGALSWFHNDDDGFSTVVAVQAGGKFWVLARWKNDDPRADEMSDFRTFQEWNVEDIDDSKWELEVVHLDPTCVLYMRPSTPHLVLGTAPSIVLGRHYYATGTIRRSCFGIVHTFVMGLGITNTFHTDATRSMLRQLMALYYRHLILHDGFERRDPHVPDMRTQDGLLDVLALGCILEFTTALSRTRYGKAYDPTTDEACADHTEENQARTWFRVLMKVYGTKYAIFLKDDILHPSYIWHSVMVGFAVTVLNYMEAKKDEVVWVAGLNLITVKAALRQHLSEDHPHLVKPFEMALAAPTPRTQLTWAGPSFRIIRKSRSFQPLLRALNRHEARDMPYQPLHPGAENAGAPDQVNSYYWGVWPGEQSPNDKGADSD